VTPRQKDRPGSDALSSANGKALSIPNPPQDDLVLATRESFSHNPNLLL
jgi:hypothetical protein